VEQALETKPDLILMDIKLKGAMDGIAAASAINDAFDVPIVYLTAYADDATLERAKITGPFGYILKPFNDRELHTTIEMAIYRHRADKLVRQSERKYHALFENSKDAIFIAEVGGPIVDGNRSFLETFCYENREISGMDIAGLCSDATDVHAFLDSLLSEGSVKDFPMTLKRKDGKTLECLINAVELRNADGVRSGYQGSVRDVTEERMLEAQLRHTQKIEAVGTLASGIAHDFNNILTTIMGYAGLLRLKTSDPSLQQYADHIVSACEKATSVTKGLLVFSRKQTLKKATINLNKVIEKFETFLGRVLRDDIVLNIEFQDKELLIFADQDQIEQVIMNLVTNARDAMPRGGMITISTEGVLIEENDRYNETFGMIGKFARLRITDTGIGIKKHVAEKIFDPFFTTKDAGKGTGLGLSITHRIIKRHDGFITLESKPGIGTSFDVLFPATGGMASEGRTFSQEIPSKGTERILLAEDETLVRDFIEVGLESQGYVVIAAKDGHEAVQAFHDHNGNFALVILDVIMPKANGKMVLSEIKGMAPGVRVLFMSGHDRGLLDKEALLENRDGFIQKPFTIEELTKKVRTLIDGPLHVMISDT
jgi:two-component system cell cycle sensor histidine kinase/response regulator CckA